MPAIKAILIWSLLLLLVQGASLFLSGFAVDLFLAEPGYITNLDKADKITTLIWAVVCFPFIYLCSYKAVMHYLKSSYKPARYYFMYLKGGSNRWHKVVGIGIGGGVAMTSSLIGGILIYIFTSELSFKGGGIPVILSILGGYRAQKKFLSKNS